MGSDRLCPAKEPRAPLAFGFHPAAGPSWPPALLGVRSAQRGACVTSTAPRAALHSVWHFQATVSSCTAKISCAFSF